MRRRGFLKLLPAAIAAPFLGLGAILKMDFGPSPRHKGAILTKNGIHVYKKLFYHDYQNRRIDDYK